MKNTEKVSKLLASPEVSSWRALFNAFKSLSSEFESSLLEHDCSVPRFQILLHLHTTGPHTPVTLSRLMKVSRANITTFLKRLTEDGLINSTIENGSEKRPAYELTKKGVKYFELVLPSHISNVKKKMPAFPEEFISLLEEVPKNLESE